MSYDLIELRRGVLELFVEAAHYSRLPLTAALTRAPFFNDGDVDRGKSEGLVLSRRNKRFAFERDPAGTAIRRLERAAVARQERATRRTLKLVRRRSRQEARAELLAAIATVVQTEACPVCGLAVERREGLSRLQHVGIMWGRCPGLPRESAAE